MSFFSIKNFNLHIREEKLLNDISFDLDKGEVLGIAGESGSGKSLTMVWLAKWIRENVKDSRVLIITDRTELDEQIEIVFRGVDEDIYRTSSGGDLVQKLNRTDKWLICSLVHKFGGSNNDEASNEDVDKFLDEIKKNIIDELKWDGNIGCGFPGVIKNLQASAHQQGKKGAPA